jgi:hypothetical protein
MTFRLKSLEDVPYRTPDVNIFFSGQLLLRSEDGATCEVGVNPLAAKHVLTIEARTKVSGADGVIKSDVVKMRHVGPLNFRRNEGMLIQVIDPVASPAAWSCRTFEPNPVHENDSRWILNLEGPLFHRRDLNPAVFPNTQHVIRLLGGEYFFRTAMRSSGRFEYLRTGGGENPLRLPRIGAVACASVFLDEDQGQTLTLNWQGLDKDVDNIVTLEKDDNTTHEIYINNTPLYLDPPADTRDEALKQFDELIEYYKIIPRSEVPPEMRFQLVPVNPLQPLPGQSGTPDIPCQVMMLNGTRD